MSPLDLASTHSRFTFEIMTTMGDVPDKVGYKMTVGAPHRFFCLRPCFSLPKAASKRLYQAHVRDLDREID
jgi:hypothetical protein